MLNQLANKEELEGKIKKEDIDKVINFFKDNPNPTDKKLHEWGKKNNFDIHDLEAEVYKLTTKFVNLLTGGRSNEKKVNEKDFDKKQIDKGIKVELEHTKDKDLAKKISIDHLTEFPNYYDALLEMEKKLKSEQSQKEGEKMKISKKLLQNLVILASDFDNKGLIEEANQVDEVIIQLTSNEIKKEAAEGIAPFIYSDLKKLVDEGKSFEEAKKTINEKHKGFELKKEDYDEIAGNKEAAVTGPGGHIPDGTGPHGRGMGPGKGKGDGSGLQENAESKGQMKKEASAKVTIESLDNLGWN